jgi:hypothetical protein
MSEAFKLEVTWNPILDKRRFREKKGTIGGLLKKTAKEKGDGIPSPFSPC